MKKFYAFLLMTGLCCLSALDAAAFTVTIEVDDASALTVTLNGETVPFSGNTAVLTYDGYQYPQVAANNGYVLNALQEKAKGSETWNTGYLNSATSHSLSLSEYTDGTTYKFTTAKLSDLRTAKVTLRVDDPSAIRFQRSWTYDSFTPTEKETVIAYVPGKETPFSIATQSGKPCYKVMVNNTEIQALYGNYTINEVNDGDVIDVQVNYPEGLTFALKFNLSEACKEGFITSVTADGVAIENWQEAQVAPGAAMVVSFNTSDFKITKFEHNGASIAPYGYYYNPYNFTMTSDATFDVEAAPYGKAKMTIKVANADYVVVYKGYNSADPANVFPLQNGTTEIEVSETENTIRLRATALATITSVTQDGSPRSKNYNNEYELEVKDGSEVVVVAEEIRRDDVMVFYFDSPAKANDGSTFYGYNFRADGSQRNITLEEGYNVVNFGTVDGDFMFSVNNGNTSNVFLYVNGAIPTFASDYMSYYFTPANGDVLKCYVGQQPASYNLQFEVEETLHPVVVVDKITPLNSLEPQTVLQGTCVSIAPAEGEEITVSVDGKEVAAVEGKHELTVNANTTVVVKAGLASGMEQTEAATKKGVYNMMGIRMDNEHLPAGIYIIDGKKTIVRQ